MSSAIITKNNVKIAVHTTKYTRTNTAAIKEWNDLRSLPYSESISEFVIPEVLSTQQVRSIESFTANSIEIYRMASLSRLLEPRSVSVK
jgi:hypothetical protein